MTLWKLTQHINLALPEELSASVNEAAKARYMSRSEYIRFVLIKELQIEPPKLPHPYTYGEIDPKWLNIDDS